MIIKSKRRGVIVVTTKFINNQAAMCALFGKCTPYRISDSPHEDMAKYYCYSELMDELAPFDPLPLYEAVFSNDILMELKRVE